MEEQQHSMIPYTALNPAKVQGSLGQPLGRLVKVAGTVLEPGQSKADQDKTFLRVDTVDGKALARSVDLSLRFFAFTGIANPKAGSRVSYTGYESGSFEGIPSESFSVMPAVASEDLHFELYFQVCREEK
ncbi:MAG TPA: hypothetical protein V6D23_06375 [Candidatus Obscuribacterales bacterium]